MQGLEGMRSSLKNQFVFIVNPRVVIAFFIPAFCIAATYTIYTYMAPMLQEVLRIPERYISLVFLLYGVVSIFSTLIGGKLAAHDGVSKLRYVFLIQALILASLYVSAKSLIGGLISISFIALVLYVVNSPMQLYFIDLADRHFPVARVLHRP